MGFLTEYEDFSIEYNGKEYQLDLAYDTVLNVRRMHREKLLSDTEILLHSLLLFGISEKEVLKLNWTERAGLLEKIYKEKIIGRPKPKVGKTRILYDFEADGEYIYASFMQDYGIDLIEQQGILPWSRFTALFQGLSKDTKIKEIIRIRGMDVPEPANTNQKEIQELMEAKMYYALPADITGNGSRIDGLNGLFAHLEREAER